MSYKYPIVAQPTNPRTPPDVFAAQFWEIHDQLQAIAKTTRGRRCEATRIMSLGFEGTQAEFAEKGAEAGLNRNNCKIEYWAARAFRPYPGAPKDVVRV